MLVTTRNDLPQFLKDLLACVPPAGAGVHGWLYRCARQLHAHRPEAEIADLLAAQVEGCGRHVPKREIEAAVRDSLSTAWKPRGADSPPPASPIKPRWPEFNPAQRAEVIAGGFALADLWEASPVRCDESGPDAEAIVDALFAGNPLLCVGADQRTAETAPRESFRGRLARLQFIVPNEMATPTGMTRDGRPSPRTLANVGPRRFLVVEFDSGTVDEHAAVLGHLADHAPLVLAVHSGGKSLHGWFRADPSEATTRAFFNHAVRLGADPATWTPCQFVRMPGSRRQNGNRQLVWFFNPPAAHAY